MTFLPIVTRELRVAARRGGTYWQRTGAALGVIVIGTWLYIVMQNEAPQKLSTLLFGTLTASALFYSLLSGVRTTADSLSFEKREGTLGLLFLTDLKGYDVVLGKLAASSLNSFYSVMAVVPVLAIPLLMGGLTPEEFGRMALVAVSTLFFSLALGIAASSVSRSAQKAMGLTAALLVVLTVVLPAFGGVVAAIGRGWSARWLLFFPSPAFAYYFAWDASYRAQPKLFWYSMVTLQSLSWLCLGLASVITPRSWQDRPAGVQRLRWRERWRLWAYGDAAERLVFRRGLLDRNPFFWLAARSRVKPALVWAFLGVLACGWVWGLAKYRRDWLGESVYITTAIILNFSLRVWLASEATRQLSDERRAGTLELLLSTPLTVAEILQGQFLALARQFLKPMIVLLIVESLFMWGTVSAAWARGESSGFWVLLWLTGMLMLVADLIALAWVGMWQGLIARNPSRATTTSLTRIMVLPWVAYGIFVLFLVLLSASPSSGMHFEGGPKFFLTVWFAFGLAADIGFGAHARNKLLRDFRLAAQQRYSSAPLFRWLGLMYGRWKLRGQS
ncbi:MAG TPA: ABC transporter permease subunit [Candidatus Limnocylindrales bacterium]|jgi:ABC-type transport system involved in multi-copper enzyme maturation permease subunit|nr:ABC transporter permease subunit [Candidatus Limnocylindrales bacterium]